MQKIAIFLSTSPMQATELHVSQIVLMSKTGKTLPYSVPRLGLRRRLENMFVENVQKQSLHFVTEVAWLFVQFVSQSSVVARRVLQGH